MMDRKSSVAPCAILLVGLLQITPSAQKNPKPRVYIEQFNSCEVMCEMAGIDCSIGGMAQGWAGPQTAEIIKAEIIKTFGKRCPLVVVTMKKDRADYVVWAPHEGGSDQVGGGIRFVVFNKEGDAIASVSTVLLRNAVKDACAAITKDLQEK